MGRPTSNTVDYFPHIARQGETLYILQSKYGNDGYAFLFKLFEILATADGHYFTCQEEVKWEYFLAYMRVEKVRAEEIIETLGALQLIDKELWNQYRVLWSQKFVDGLTEVYRKRGRGVPEKPILDTTIPLSGADKGVPVAEISQSRAKESRGEKSTSTASRTSAHDEKSLTEKDFILKPDDDEFPIWCTKMQNIINQHNAERNGRGPFTWKPTCGNKIEDDLRSLAYRISDEKKKELLYSAYNVLEEKLNWLTYVELGIRVMLAVSLRKPVHEPYKFVWYLIHRPQEIINEQERNGISGAFAQPVSAEGGV